MKKIFVILLFFVSLSSFSQAKWHLIDEYIVKDSLNNVTVKALIEIYSGSNNRLVFAVILNNDTTTIYGASLIVVPKDCEFKVMSDCNKLALSTPVLPVLRKGEKVALMYRSRQEIIVKKVINILSGENLIYDSEQ